MRNELLADSHREKEPSPGYFEWWYFHFVGEDGTAINLVLHETDIFGLEKEPYMSVSFLEPGKKPLHLSYQRKNAIVKNEAKKINFSLFFGQDVRFEGEMIKLAKPLMIENGILYRDFHGRTSNWVVDVPHASFEGVLVQDKNETKIKGFGYQDHQWGTLPLQEFVSDWAWGHFADRENSIIFFKILTQGGEYIDRVGVMTEGREDGYTFCRADYLKDLSLMKRPDKGLLTGKVFFSEARTGILFQIKPSGLMRSRVSESHGIFEASYLRWISEGFIFGKELNGITEYLKIRK